MRKKIRDINNFIVYYGYGNEGMIKKYDLAILEPKGQSKESINTLKETGVTVLAYVSVMEVSGNYESYKLLRDEDFLLVRGQRVKNEEYSTYLIDLSSKRWQSMLLHHIGNLIYNYSYDGVFLDTLGDIEDYDIPAEHQNKLMNSAVNFLKQLKEQFESIIVVQNNGVGKLSSLTADFIQGICWENPPLCKDSSKDWVETVAKQLKYLQLKKSITVLILIEEKDNETIYVKEAQALASYNGFLLYKAPYRYIS